LRVDKKFRVHGPERLRMLYKLKSAIERVNSRMSALKGRITLKRTEGCNNTGLICDSGNAFHSLNFYKDWKAGEG